MLNNLDNTDKVKDGSKVEAEYKVKTEIKHIGTLTPYPGHRVWEMDLATGVITEVTFSKYEMHVFGENHGKLTREILKKEKHNYTCALNKRNAKKNFDNGVLGGIPEGKLNINDIF